MSSIKQIITNAINKVSTDSQYAGKAYENADEARADFTKFLLAELFPENPSVPSPKVKKVKAKKAVEELATAMEGLTVDSVPETTAPLPPSPENKERKKRAPMSDEAKAAMKAKRDATVAAKKSPAPTEGGSSAAAEPEPVEEKPKKKARKAKTAADANLPKIDPTWKKHLKKAAGDKYGKDLENELLTFVNAMDNTAFNNTGAEDHIKTFMAQKDKPAPMDVDDGKVEAEMDIVEFNGKDYYVNPETKRVYEGEGEMDAEGSWTNYKAVGYVGMAAFAEMKLE